MKRLTTFLMAALLSMSVLLAACAPSEAASPEAPAGQSSAESEPVTFKVAVLPIVDALPMYVADREGLFANHGVAVEFVPVASAAERDQLLAAGQVDGTINETLSAIFFNKEEVQIQVLRYAFVPTPENAHFFILASGKSGIDAPEGLKGVEIGVSQGTVIEYVTDRLLQAEGFTEDEIATIAVPKIPDRMALLGSGELQAAVLPDPLASLAIQQGAVIAMDDSQYPQYGFSVLSFRKDVIDAQPEALRGFLAAVEEATTLINADPAKYASVLSDKKLVPPPLLETYKTPTFPTAGVPTEAEWNDALAWAQEKGLLEADVPYAGSVNADFLP